MHSLADVIAQHSDLTAADVGHLQRLTDEWELLADLAFSDLILWVPDADPNVFWAAAQVRPTTGPTALTDDVVGEEIAYEPDNLVTEAYLSEEIAETSGNKLHAGIPVDQHAVPVMLGGRVIGIVEMHTNRLGLRAPGALEDNYLELAGILRGMVCRGEFPMPSGEPSVPWVSPRVVDGSLRVDPAGDIVFASPNAVSAFRRLGVGVDIQGERFRDLLMALPAEARSAMELTVSDPKCPLEFDLDTHRASVRCRVQPLRSEDGPCGYLVMSRDTTELRSRERQLVTKDATIREIHHRVKNNLQTVSALLRLQARRTASAETTNALNDAQKRVAAIAVVHEILSRAFDSSVHFDDVADRLLAMVREVNTSYGHVTIRRVGTFGQVPAAAATSLSLILTEVAQNAIEHGLVEGVGTVIVRPLQADGRLLVEVTNDGTPLADDFSLDQAKGLGLSIVATLIEDLEGTFEITNLPDGAGTVARIDIPVA